MARRKKDTRSLLTFVNEGNLLWSQVVEPPSRLIHGNAEWTPMLLKAFGGKLRN